MQMREYLETVAREITAAAPIALPAPAEWDAWRRQRRAQYLALMGLDRWLAAERTPLNAQMTHKHSRDGYTIECLCFESLPKLYVAANLYVPHGAVAAPTILYLCGHAHKQKVHYQNHARRFAQLGFVTLVLDTIQYGEVWGHHHGTYRLGCFHWYSRGYNPAAVETWNAIRALDLLQARPEVDQNRIGVTGNSGGAAITWNVAVADDRARVVSPSCSTSTIASHICDRTIDEHCDCTFPNNAYGWSLVDFAALIAPRPLLIASADHDDLNNIAGIEDFHSRLQVVYKHLGVPERLSLFTYLSPHGYTAVSRRYTYTWFIQQLQGRTVTADDVADADDVRESDEALAVFRQGTPPNDRSTTVQDWFVGVSQPQEIASVEVLSRERERVVTVLWRDTFATFPQPLPDIAMQPVRSFLNNAGYHEWFTYVTERDWRLNAGVRYPAGDPYITGAVPESGLPVVVELLSPDERRGAPSTSLTDGCPASWLRAYLAVRGTGQTAWPLAQQWNLRRSAALTGRTLASLRVLDLLQGLRAIRSRVGVDPGQVYVAAKGEMATVALYAALLDGHVAGLILFDPPATQNVPGPIDGSGPVLEMLNCLRYTDLPQVAGLLWPCQLVFVGLRPDTYRWAEDLYSRLGAPGAWWVVPELHFWRPM